MSNSLQHHWPGHTRLLCPPLSPRVCSNSCPLSRWCHPTISFSVVPFSSGPQSFLASGSFHMSQLFTSGGRSIGVSDSASVLPMNTQDWSPLGWTGCHWKDWCWSWSSSTLATWCEELTHWKRPWCWERLRAGGEVATQDEMVGWHHWLNGHEFGWTLGVGDGQGGLACCSSWGCKESEMIKMNWTVQTRWISQPNPMCFADTMCSLEI